MTIMRMFAPFVGEPLSQLNKAIRAPFALNDAKPQNVKLGLQEPFVPNETSEKFQRVIHC